MEYVAGIAVATAIFAGIFYLVIRHQEKKGT